MFRAPNYNVLHFSKRHVLKYPTTLIRAVL